MIVQPIIIIIIIRGIVSKLAGKVDSLKKLIYLRMLLFWILMLNSSSSSSCSIILNNSLNHNQNNHDL
jgi:hypothetical protein